MACQRTPNRGISPFNCAGIYAIGLRASRWPDRGAIIFCSAPKSSTTSVVGPAAKWDRRVPGNPGAWLGKRQFGKYDNSPSQIQGSYQGGVPSGTASITPLALSLDHALRRGIQYNLGAGEAARQARAQRLASLAELPPDITRNLRTAALVSTDGTIDFFCAPCFDSLSLFASLLDDERGVIVVALTLPVLMRGFWGGISSSGFMREPIESRAESEGIARIVRGWNGRQGTSSLLPCSPGTDI